MATDPDNQREKEIFEQALDLESLELRLSFVQSACGADTALFARMRALLLSDAEASRFLPDASPLQGRPSEEIGAMIGRYKLLQEIGEGGMGVVYMAEQEEPVRRRVALKIIKFGMDTKSVIARFEAERQALAMMDHPNIAKVLDAGATDTGRPYFVMELVRGKKITEYCDEAKLSTRERLDLFIKVCSAIQHAHQKGIIHRDIKPSNILVTINDGVAVPKVIDFGIAKAIEGRLTNKTLFTKFEMFIGTPAYVSPEQAVMTSLDVDTRSDIYSLGVLLYELMVGSTPFDATELLASGVDAMRKTILEKEPMRPSNRFNALQGEELTTATQRRSTDSSKLKRQLTGDLDWIVMKCLEKDRARRYATANGLATDIQRHIDNETVLASPPSATYRVQKMIRRNKLAFLAITSVIAALVLGIVASSILAIRASNAKAGEVLQGKLADMQLAQVAWEEGDFQRAQDLIAASRSAPGHPPSFEWRYLQNLCRDQSIQTVGTNKQYRAALFFDDNSLLIAGATSLFLYDISLREFRLLLKDQDGISKLALCSGNTNLLATVTDRWKLKVWNLAATHVDSDFTLPRGTLNDFITFSPDGRWLASANKDHSVNIWNVKTGDPNPVQIAQRYNSWVSDLVFSRDGTQLFSGGGERMIRTWNVLTGKEEGLPLEGHSTWVYALALTQDGLRLASGGPDQSVILWDLMSRKPETKMFGHMAPVRSVAFSPDQKILASGGRDSTIRLWDGKSGLPISLLRGHTDMIKRLEFSPDGRLLLSQGNENVIKLWRVASGPVENTLYGGKSNFRGVSISPDGLHVAAVESGEYAVYLWDLSTGKKTRFDGHTNWVLKSVFSPDSKILATASHDETVKLWDVVQGKLIATLTNGFPVGSVAFLPDGRTLIAGGSPINFIAEYKGGIQFWDIPSQQRIATVPGIEPGIVNIAVSADGKMLATGHDDGTTALWNIQTLQLLHQFEDQSVGSVISLVFSPTEPLLAAGDWDGNIVIYNTARMETARPRAKAHTARVMALAFSPDGRTLASGGEGGGIKLWHVGMLQVALSLKGVSNSVVFSPDGNFLVSCGLDGTLRLWPAPPLEETKTSH